MMEPKWQTIYNVLPAARAISDFKTSLPSQLFPKRISALAGNPFFYTAVQQPVNQQSCN